MTPRVLAPLFGVLFLISCGGSSEKSGPGQSDSTASTTVGAGVVAVPNGEVVDVQVLDNSYRPLDITIAVGTEVRFVNKGRNEHNILPDGVKSDAELTELLSTDESATAWGVVSTELAPGDDYSHVFLEAGTYPYYCSIHGVPGKGMYGVVIVE